MDKAQASELPGPADTQRWFEGKELTADWLGAKLATWLPVLAPMRTRAVNVLELGSYEGRSAIAFLEFLPLANVVTVDFFPDAEVEARCRRNLAPYGERATIMKGWGSGILDELTNKKRQFDVAYIDAGKSAHGVLARSVLVWGLLKLDAIVIWDDLRWGADRPPLERPGTGIDTFASLFGPCMTVLLRQRQLIARKTAEWPMAAEIR